MNDARFALRQLLKNPGFAAAAVLTLALGMAASTVVFTIFNSIFLRPLPFPQSERMVSFYLENKTKDGTAAPSLADLRDLAAAAQSFEALGLYRYDYGTFSAAGAPVTVTIGRSSPGVFRALGVPAAIGRTLEDSDHEPSKPSVAVLNHDTWQSHFGGAPDIVGRTIQLNQKSYAVVGVMPPGFRDPWDNARLWVPIQPSPFEAQNRYERWGSTVGRLKPGVPVERAASELAAIAANVAQSNPTTNAELTGARVSGLHGAITGYGREAVLVVLGASALMLLMAIANTAGLMLLRVARRQGDLATRAALGASRARLLAGCVAEAALLAVAAGALAAALTRAGLHAVLALLPGGYLPRLGEIQADWSTFGFVLGIALLSCLAVAFSPALALWRTSPARLLAGRSRGSEGASGARLRRVLIVAQLATAVALLAAAGLLTAHLLRLQQTSLGLRLDNGLALRLNLPRMHTDTNEKRARYLDELLRAVQEVPGISAAGISTTHPLGWSVGTDVLVEGQPDDIRPPNVPRDYVSPGFFTEAGIRTIAGRVLDDTDGPGSPPGMVIDQALARRLFGDADPLGRRLRLGKEAGAFAGEIIGVVSDIRRRGPLTASEGQIYLSHRWGGFPFVTLIVRASAGSPESLASAVQAALHRADPDQRAIDAKPLRVTAREQTTLPRVQSVLVGLFAGLSMLLTAVGLYSLMAFAVGQRLPEFGIRMALGAEAGRLVRLVLGEGLRLATFGLLVGAALSGLLLLAGKPWLSDVRLLHPGIFVAVPIAILLISAAACWLPARRAAKVDPVLALRAE